MTGFAVPRARTSRRLDAAQLAEIREDLLAGPRKPEFETDIWTGKILVEHIRRKHGITFVPRTMQTLMHGMGPGTSCLGRGTPKPLPSRRKRCLKKASQLARYYSN